MNEKTVKQLKWVLKNVAGLGISMLCGAAASMIIVGSGQNSGIKKGLMAVGGSVIGGMVAKHAEGYIDAQVDEVVEFVNEFQKKFEEKPAEAVEGA